MISPVVFWFFRVKSNVLMHVHILKLKFGPCLFNGLTLVLSQCTILFPNLWLFFVYIIVLLLSVGRAILPNISPQNYRLTKWSWLETFRVSIVLGFFLRGGIHKVPGVLPGHHVLFVQLAGVHIFPYLPVRRCTHCALFP